MQSIYKIKEPKKIDKNELLTLTPPDSSFEGIKNNFIDICGVFKFNFDPSTLRIKGNITSGFDEKKKEIASIINDENKITLVVYSAPDGKPVKLVSEEYISF